MARGGVERRVKTQLPAAPSGFVARRLGLMARGTGQLRYSQGGRGQCMTLQPLVGWVCHGGGGGMIDGWSWAKKSRLCGISGPASHGQRGWERVT